MPSFKYTWDDFSGGYYVGQLDNRQPKNTYTGFNVAPAVTDGAAVAVDSNVKLTLRDPGGTVSWINGNANLIVGANVNNSNHISTPVFCNGVIFAASLEYNAATMTYHGYVYAIKPESSGGFSDTYRSSVISPALTITTGSSPICTDPVCVIVDESTTDVYVSFFNNIVYRYRFSGSSWSSATLITTNVPTSPYQGRIIKLAIWGFRMIAVVLGSDTLYFSDLPVTVAGPPASQQYNSWSSLNYLAPASSTDGINDVVIKDDQLYVIKSSGVYAVGGVLGSNAYVRRIKQISPMNYLWFSSATEYQGQIYYIPRETPARLLRVFGQNSIGSYYNFGNTGITSSGSVNRYAGVNTTGTQAASITTTHNDYVAFACNSFSGTPDYIANTFVIMTMQDGVWVKRQFPKMTSTNTVCQYVCNKTNSYVDDAWYASNTRPSRIYIMQRARSSSLGNEQVEVSFGYIDVYDNAAGLSGSAFSTGTIVTSPLNTEKPSKITRVYVEVEVFNNLGQQPNSSETPQITVTVNNIAVDDVNFLPSLQYTSTPMTYTAPAMSTIGNDSITRVLRFDSNDTGYGYKHTISLTFKGFRIKSIWAEGETR